MSDCPTDVWLITINMEGNIYHILNRGVEKRKVFLDDKDHIRFIHGLKDFNTTESNGAVSYYKRRDKDKCKEKSDIACPTKTGNLNIVDVLCWALVPNHPHVMVAEKEIGNAGKFSRKIFGGYTKYFNEQNDRSGVLFQGRSKIILIEHDAHFLYLPFYIHLNPLDLFCPGWKDHGIKDVKGAIEFLEEYRWSNYRDIIGKGNGEFSDVFNKELFFELFQTNEKKYKKDFEEWIKSAGYRQVGHAMSDFDLI